MTARRVGIVACGLVTAAACGAGSPVAPKPVPDAPTLSCPASIAAESLDGAAVTLAFVPPTAAGGQPPVSVTCTAQSGSAFPIGSTTVSCTATDSFSRQASCTFNVAVSIVPRISKTRFLAFGDSITYGRCDAAPKKCDEYTVRIGELLRVQYPRQSFVVTPRGVPGEEPVDGQLRLPVELTTYNPEVLLLMEGTNSVNDPASTHLVPLAALEEMVSRAQSRGVIVFLATIPPARAPGYTQRALAIPGFNAQVRLMAARRGAILVDIFAAMNADVTRYVGADDLHPSEEGMRLIGETFYAAIRQALDVTPIPSGRHQ